MFSHITYGHLAVVLAFLLADSDYQGSIPAISIALSLNGFSSLLVSISHEDPPSTSTPKEIPA